MMRRWDRPRRCSGAADLLRSNAMGSFEERRAARAAWPIRAVRLGDEALVDERDPTTPDERLAMVWTLTREQWALAGLRHPDYTRAEMPGNVVRKR